MPRISRMRSKFSALKGRRRLLTISGIAELYSPDSGTTVRIAMNSGNASNLNVGDSIQLTNTDKITTITVSIPGETPFEVPVSLNFNGTYTINSVGTEPSGLQRKYYVSNALNAYAGTINSQVSNAFTDAVVSSGT